MGWGAACSPLRGQAGIRPRGCCWNKPGEGWAPDAEAGALQRTRVQTLHPKSWKNPLPGWVAALVWLWCQALGAVVEAQLQM